MKLMIADTFRILLERDDFLILLSFYPIPLPSPLQHMFLKYMKLMTPCSLYRFYLERRLCDHDTADDGPRWILLAKRIRPHGTFLNLKRPLLFPDTQEIRWLLSFPLDQHSAELRSWDLHLFWTAWSVMFGRDSPRKYRTPHEIRNVSDLWVVLL